MFNEENNIAVDPLHSCSACDSLKTKVASLEQERHELREKCYQLIDQNTELKFDLNCIYLKYSYYLLPRTNDDFFREKARQKIAREENYVSMKDHRVELEATKQECKQMMDKKQAEHNIEISKITRLFDEKIAKLNKSLKEKIEALKQAGEEKERLESNVSLKVAELEEQRRKLENEGFRLESLRWKHHFKYGLMMLMFKEVKDKTAELEKIFGFGNFSLITSKHLDQYEKHCIIQDVYEEYCRLQEEPLREAINNRQNRLE